RGAIVRRTSAECSAPAVHPRIGLTRPRRMIDDRLMTQPIVQVDSFTSTAFAGNPAGVCLLDASRDDGWMQLVAREMNVAETAFLQPRTAGEFDLRWFTPTVEVDLCGHATLASAHVLWESGRFGADALRFHTRSGVLTATRRDGWIDLDFPATPAEPV